MPSSKDLKKLVRARMSKTGESYTAARARLLEKKLPPLPPDLAALAGIKDAAIKARTGRSWRDWVRALDAIGAAAMPHREIARRVHGDFGVGDWWSQTVTVGYERIRGLRQIGQRRDGRFEANKSKVIKADLATVYRAVADGRARARWLPAAEYRVRSMVEGKSVRLAWGDGTAADLWFGAPAPGKCQVAVQHRKLPDRASADRLKGYWAEALGALAAVVVPRR